MAGFAHREADSCPSDPSFRVVHDCQHMSLIWITALSLAGKMSGRELFCDDVWYIIVPAKIDMLRNILILHSRFSPSRYTVTDEFTDSRSGRCFQALLWDLIFPLACRREQELRFFLDFKLEPFQLSVIILDQPDVSSPGRSSLIHVHPHLPRPFFTVLSSLAPPNLPKSRTGPPIPIAAEGSLGSGSSSSPGNKRRLAFC